MEREQAIDARWAFAGGGLMQPRAIAPEPVRVSRAIAEPAESAESAERARLAGLIERMASRDERALAEFYDATSGKAFGVTLRIVRNQQLAEEVVADSYHQSWREAGRYDRQRGTPITWLLMMCRSRALDALRARDCAITHEDPETLLDPASQASAPDALDLLAAVESRHAVHAALTLLSASQRQMIGLAFFRCLSHQEIAVQTGLPLGTVKSQIRRALETLRRTLQPQ